MDGFRITIEDRHGDVTIRNGPDCEDNTIVDVAWESLRGHFGEECFNLFHLCKMIKRLKYDSLSESDKVVVSAIEKWLNEHA